MLSNDKTEDKQKLEWNLFLLVLLLLSFDVLVVGFARLSLGGKYCTAAQCRFADPRDSALPCLCIVNIKMGKKSCFLCMSTCLFFFFLLFFPVEDGLMAFLMLRLFFHGAFFFPPFPLLFFQLSVNAPLELFFFKNRNRSCGVICSFDVFSPIHKTRVSSCT